MRRFDSIDGFLRFLGAVPRRLEQERRVGLDEAGEHIEATMRAEIGTYQQGAGPFGDWPDLARSTVASKPNSPPDNPELRTGQLRASIQHRVDADGVNVGSDDPVMAYQEFGTSRMAPRSIVGLGMFRAAPAAAAMVAEREIDAITGAPVRSRGGKVSR